MKVLGLLTLDSITFLFSASIMLLDVADVWLACGRRRRRASNPCLEEAAGINAGARPCCCSPVPSVEDGIRPAVKNEIVSVIPLQGKVEEHVCRPSRKFNSFGRAQSSGSRGRTCAVASSSVRPCPPALVIRPSPMCAGSSPLNTASESIHQNHSTSGFDSIMVRRRGSFTQKESSCLSRSVRLA